VNGIQRLNDAERLVVQIGNLTAASVDLRTQPARTHRALFQSARDLRDMAQRSRARRRNPIPLGEWWRTETRVEWAIARIRVAIGDPIQRGWSGSVTFPPGEGPMHHTRENDIRLVLDYLEEITR
jgi:hypothetical protein